ncbi:uncharacterized protein F4807DRAFT_460778 [Annulohypoxylon truncatum]|uniref:uncharacterized protein n=1 Tax=Annulohypoxylon truncatum TaxID=327061 RepID=UPI002007B7C0|nr:uncharacterized protein F4807DRAFT_460778 [Annulohypoxylon truncatum]KAI1209561.1 hypothetical protein F4807DRAFT_460778 [Annulohypoxylon truncatum]
MNEIRREYPGVPDNGPQTNSITWAFVAVATTFLGLRMACKRRRRSHLWSDDWFLVASWVPLTISCVLVSVNIAAGFGKHDEDIDPEVLGELGLRNVVVGSLFTISSAWSKTSFAISLLRIATPHMRILIWTVVASMNIFLHVAAVLTWVACHPIEKLWMYTPEGECWPSAIIMPMGVFFNAYSGFSDLVLVLLSWRIVMKLRINLKEKIGVAIAMSMGLFAGGIAIVKTVELTVINERDFNSEIATTIIAASIPVLRTLICDLTWCGGNRAAAGNRYLRFNSPVENREAGIETGADGTGTISGSVGGYSATSGSRKSGAREKLSNNSRGEGSSPQLSRRGSPRVMGIEESRERCGHREDAAIGIYEMENLG